jgi:TRAP-type mannitol/chloroaromatic compound transport system permease small subunit|tara:strand:+ start:197 stop:697 length:501 start_codon:yes stop_codon:yes gene_type:complete
MNNFQLLTEQIMNIISKLLVYILLSMIGLVILTIFLRYFFSIGSISIQELIMYFHASIFMLGISYTYKENSHVKIDIFYNKLSEKNKTILSLIGVILLIIPFAIFIIFISFDMVSSSWSIFEGSSEAGGLDLVFILKSLIPLSGFLILLQALSELFKNLQILKNEY